MWLLPAGCARIKLRPSKTKKLNSKSGKLVESPIRQEIYSFIKGYSNTRNLIQKLFRHGFFNSFRELEWTKQLSKWRSVYFLGLAALFGQVWKLIWTLVWTKQVSSGPPEHLAAIQMWLLVHLQIQPGANYTLNEKERESERHTERDREPKRWRILEQYCFFQPKLLHHPHHCPPELEPLSWGHVNVQNGAVPGGSQ